MKDGRGIGFIIFLKVEDKLLYLYRRQGTFNIRRQGRIIQDDNKYVKINSKKCFYYLYV